MSGKLLIAPDCPFARTVGDEVLERFAVLIRDPIPSGPGSVWEITSDAALQLADYLEECQCIHWVWKHPDKVAQLIKPRRFETPYDYLRYWARKGLSLIHISEPTRPY